MESIQHMVGEAIMIRDWDAVENFTLTSHLLSNNYVPVIASLLFQTLQ